MKILDTTRWRDFSAWCRSSLWCIAVVLLAYFVVGIAFNNGHLAASQVRYTTVRPVLVPNTVQIDLPHHSDDRKIFPHEQTKLFSTDRPIGNHGSPSGFDVTGRRIGWKDGFVSTGKYPWGLFVEPSIRLPKGIISKEDLSPSTRFNRRRLSIISIEEVDHDQLVGGEKARLSEGNDIRSLILLKLTPGAIQLEVGNAYSGSGNDEHQAWKKRHPQVYPLLKAGYLILLLTIAFLAVFRAHVYLIRDWNRWALLKVLLAYVVGGGIVFHAVWVLVFA